jgi:hypothetical protein
MSIMTKAEKALKKAEDLEVKVAELTHRIEALESTAKGGKAASRAGPAGYDLSAPSTSGPVPKRGWTS